MAVTLTPSSYGSKEALLAIFTNDPHKTSGVSVTLKGNAAPPKMAVSPLTVEFGTKGTGTGSTKKVSVRNTGLSDLTVTSVNLSGDESFTETNDCGIIAHNESCAVNATFAPTAQGLQTGQISIVPGYGPTVQVKLSGRGK